MLGLVFAQLGVACYLHCITGKDPACLIPPHLILCLDQYHQTDLKKKKGGVGFFTSESCRCYLFNCFLRLKSC